MLAQQLMHCKHMKSLRVKSTFHRLIASDISLIGGILEIMPSPFEAVTTKPQLIMNWLDAIRQVQPVLTQQ